mmetsp:Transcript_138458/g.441747  ORF Transcript_138458/g.441747 Transcript_138458/m.441747 type:complete len:328 (+) Transcript_138458:425-1408(+)
MSGADCCRRLLFPNQTPGVMGARLQVAGIPRAQQMLQQAASILECDLERLLNPSSTPKAEMPRYGQPILYVASCLATERLRSERSEAVERCQAVAGVGVGEFAALYAAGVLDFATGLRLVLIRSEEMQRAAAHIGETLQLSVTGMDLERVISLCAEVCRSLDGKEVCNVAYSVAPKALICAGTTAAVQQLLSLVQSRASSQEVRASIMESPKGATFGAFQTSLMEQAKQHLRTALYEALPLLKPPRCAVYFNVMGEALPAGAQPTLIVELLAEQLTSTVLWEQTIRTMLREGIDELVVCGPAHASQLKDVVRKISPEAGGRTRLCGV